MKNLWRNLHLQQRLSRLKKKFLGSTLVMILALNLLTGANYISSATERPNIVFILTDDLDENVFNQDTGLQALLTSQGTKFANHFASIPLCCPSRVTTLRGQFAHNTGIFANEGENGGGFKTVYDKGLENSTIATWLQAAGYRTALFGKYLNGYPSKEVPKTYIPPGWTHFVSPNGGFPYSEYNYSLNENGTTFSYGSTPSEYMVDVLAAKTVFFINDAVDNHPNQPFFIYLAPYIPHEPATPPERHIGAFPGAQAPRTASFNELFKEVQPGNGRLSPLESECA